MLLAADLVISEFMANSNLGGDDGTEVDWIELYNPTDTQIDLAGWHLTDDADELDKWEFPALTIDAGDFLVVSASGLDDKTDPADLHTNFKLSGDGEYLALVSSDGTVSHDFGSTYPRQTPGVSYGTPFDFLDGVPLILKGAEADIHIPNDDSLGTRWTSLDFSTDEGDWFTGETAIGYGIDVPDLSVSGFTVYQAHSTGKLTSMADGDTLLAGEGVLSETTVRGVSFINYLDTGDDGHFAGNSQYPDGGGNSFAMRATATLVVSSAGEYTFGSSFDQGARLTIDGEILIENSSTNSTHDEFSSAVTLTEGIHELEYVMLQKSRNSGAELFVAPGSHRGFSDAFRLLGDAEIAGLSVFATSTKSDVTDISGQMQGVGTSAYLRLPFDAEDVESLESLVLKMQYADGFVAYINGVQVASADVSGGATWNSVATGERTAEEALNTAVFDISDHLADVNEGLNILSIHALSSSNGDDTFLVIPELFTGGLLANEPVFFGVPTPGSANSSEFLGFVADTTFSTDRGFYDAPFQLEIASKTDGATIRYTTDGSPPTASTGTIYVSPITISRTTTLRAAAFKPGFRPTNVDTQTYIFVDDVIQQTYDTTIAAGFPATWGGTSADYGLDADVIGPRGTDDFGGVYARSIKDDLKAIPTVSIVTEIDTLFAPDGIYSNSTQRGVAWERLASIEIIQPDGSKQIQVDAGLRIQGGAFRRFDLTKKKGFRLSFKEKYGPTKLNYNLFGDGATTSFDTLILRPDNNDGWQWSGAGSQPVYARDQFGRDTQIEMGEPGSHSQHMHLYINGVYWGMYNAVERPDGAFGSSYTGGEKEDWDSLKHPFEVIDGDMVAWNTLLQMVRKVDSAANKADRLVAYQEVQGLNLDGTNNTRAESYLDVDNLIDYMIVNIYGDNTDWPHNNFYAGRQRGLDSPGFQFFVWDAEWTFGIGSSVNGDKTRIGNGIAEPHGRLLKSEEYQMRFADHLQKHFFNGGTLYVDPDNPAWDPEHPERNVPAARFMGIVDSIEQAIVGESARWGDQHRGTPYTRDIEWQNEINNLINNWFPQRSRILLEKFRNAGLYPAIDAAVFEVDGRPQHGGAVQGDQELTLDIARGRGIKAYYTTDGSDPRLLGGDISPTAIEYDGGPIVLTEATNLRVRVVQVRDWSALNEAQFVINEPASDDNLTVSEINYNPSDLTTAELRAGFEDADQFEFIELLNKNNGPISLAGVTFTDGVEFNFDDATVNTLDVGQRLVLVSDSTAFAARYGDGVSIAGEYTGGLSNGGEALAATGLDGETIFDFEYDDNNGWPGRADGGGSSLELIAADGTLADDGTWRSSAEFNGSPGSEGSGPARDVVINEVLSNSPDLTVDEIELFNTTGADIDVSGWLLSDSSSDYGKFAISAGTVIAAGGYLVLDENDFNPTAGEATTDFAFNGAHGDDAWLIETANDGRMLWFADHVDFGAMADGETFGRSPNGTGRLVPNVSATLGAANNVARIGPLVISEVMYNPDDIDSGDLEYIEIYNPTGATIDMTDWRLDGGVEITFDPGTTLGAGKSLVVIRFNPENAENAPRLADFKAEYNLDESVQIVGGYKGRLDNGGERLELLRPGTPPLDEPDFVPGLLEDEVRYDDESPWPAADGTGESLTRTTIDELGDLHTSWEAAAPTPGSVSFAPPPATPVVIGVSVSGSEWSDEFIAAVGGQVDVVDSNTPLPWSGIDQIHVQLNGDPPAPLTKDDLIIGGGPDRVSSVSYDAANFVVTWNLAAPLDVERLDLSITSDLVSAESGGRFSQVMNVLPGDVNGSFAADLRDVQAMRAAFLSVVGDAEYNPNIDIDGNSEIDIRDLQQLRGNLLESLPQAAAANEADWNVAVDAAIGDLFGE